MIAGDPKVLALEAHISRAYSRLSLRALGYFAIYVAGCRFGLYKPQATLLACSFDAVGQRIASRGLHVAPFAEKSPAADIADAFYKSIYTQNQAHCFLGVGAVEFRKIFLAEPNKCMWAPDGDAAFDDGSYVLQFDVADRVRIVAFKSSPGYCVDRGTLAEVWLKSENFYNTLRVWLDAFEKAWAGMPKSPEEV